MRVIWQSEIDPYASAVLRKHWPDVPNIGSVEKAVFAERPSILCGGPPCQSTSVAAAIQGKRTGHSLWPLMREIGRYVHPDWLVVEQPPGNKAWEAVVAGDLESIGYCVAKFQLSSARCGAAHERWRVFFVANTVRERCETVARLAGSSPPTALAGTAPPRGTWREAGTGSRRMDDGFPGWVDRLTALGNALDPRVAEIIGRAIVTASVQCFGWEGR
jgi:DNA (cytosine-5)-methyltransferase 1